MVREIFSLAVDFFAALGAFAVILATVGYMWVYLA